MSKHHDLNQLEDAIHQMVAGSQPEIQSRRIKRVWADRKAKEVLNGPIARTKTCTSCAGRDHHVIAGNVDAQTAD